MKHLNKCVCTPILKEGVGSKPYVKIKTAKKIAVEKLSLLLPISKKMKSTGQNYYDIFSMFHNSRNYFLLLAWFKSFFNCTTSNIVPIHLSISWSKSWYGGMEVSWQSLQCQCHHNVTSDVLLNIFRDRRWWEFSFNGMNCSIWYATLRNVHRKLARNIKSQLPSISFLRFFYRKRFS